MPLKNGQVNVILNHTLEHGSKLDRLWEQAIKFLKQVFLTLALECLSDDMQLVEESNHDVWAVFVLLQQNSFVSLVEDLIPETADTQNGLNVVEFMHFVNVPDEPLKAIVDVLAAKTVATGTQPFIEPILKELWIDLMFREQKNIADSLLLHMQRRLVEICYSLGVQYQIGIDLTDERIHLAFALILSLLQGFQISSEWTDSGEERFDRWALLSDELINLLSYISLELFNEALFSL